jgi:hypothetical protein
MVGGTKAEKEPLYQSPGVKGKREFDDLECYQSASEFGDRAIREEPALFLTEEDE